MTDQVNKETEKKKGKLSRESMREALEVFRFILPYKWYFIAGLVMLVFTSSVFLVFPTAAGEFANLAEGKSTLPIPLTLNQLILVLFGLLLMQSIISFVRLYFFTVVSERGMADLRKALYHKLVTLPLPFYDERRVGELTSRITNDVSMLQSAFSGTLVQFIRQLVIFIGGLIIIFIQTPRLSGIMLATFPIIVIAAMILGRRIRKISKKRQDELANSNVVVDETLQSINVVKAFTSEWKELFRYGRSVDRVINISMKLAIWRGVFFMFITTVMFGAIFFILYQGAIMVQNDKLDIGKLLSFIFYSTFIGGAIAAFGGVYEQLLSTLGATERVREILREGGEPVREEKPLQPEERFEGNIAFENVDFSYPTRPDMQILKSINFSIESGRKVALVGSSGAGKSTIFQLFLQFYRPDSGQILVDGKPAHSYDLTQFRQNMAFVPQEVLLFGGSILENIEYGKPGATEAEIIEAAKKANCWEFISQFPEGLNTVVGERGIKLSGGQRQRIAIARAILRDPAILLLDEATSSLDAESEKVVQDALNVLMENRTSIIIAHRLATIKDVDQIYVLENGQIIEQGTHTELADIEDGAYSNLARLQFELESE
ncbi:MAG: ABC transporter transmembrane domain-containing protein [Bacteroidota bacterium]